MDSPSFRIQKASLALSLTLIFSSALCTRPAGAATISLAPLMAQHETVAATESTGCAVPAASASIAGAPYFSMPEIAKLKKVTGETVVRVDLDKSGRVQGQRLQRSSGNQWLDGAAMTTARLSRYSPEIRDCVKVAGSYLIAVAFTEEDWN
ncbi:MAG TPA: energy transducer TonB [Candidatus Acidoferrum sp.]|nr:energy transducer TonB [Candidatus Acidoferrum sp.]